MIFLSKFSWNATYLFMQVAESLSLHPPGTSAGTPSFKKTSNYGPKMAVTSSSSGNLGGPIKSGHRRRMSSSISSNTIPLPAKVSTSFSLDQSELFFSCVS